MIGNSQESARALAARVLIRVIDEDAYAAAALSAALELCRLESRDRGLVTELVYGVLRTHPYLLRRLAAFGKIKVSDPILSSHLAIAAYQILFLDRVPAHAAVDEAVGLIQSMRGRKVGGFANAILRKLVAEAKLERTPLAEAVLASCPSWLKKRLVREVGEEETRALLVPNDNPRPYLRFSASALLPDWVGEVCHPVPETKHLYRFDGGGDPRRYPEYSAGLFSVQELGAALVGHSVGARSGERVLDVCAGRGQKSMILAEGVGPSGSVVATDLHHHKVASLELEAKRMGVSTIEAKAWDWTEPPPEEWRDQFDRVLVDAPCTGVGTLRRRPEILRRLQADAPARLSELQATIVSHAAQVVRPGGILVFSTCSVLALEGPAHVSRLVDDGSFSLAPPDEALSRLLRRGPGSVEAVTHLLPKRDGTDGYFLARFQRSESR